MNKQGTKNDVLVTHLIGNYYMDAESIAVEEPRKGLKEDNRRLLEHSTRSYVMQKLLHLQDVNKMLQDINYRLTDAERKYCLEYFSEEMDYIFSDLLEFMKEAPYNHNAQFSDN